ncbi:Bax inhibitor-1/YccA family protein [[Clostridium] fimetarium]|uniref:Modulator of FtsH protease n=1 Tax=[Clostridium] fimetarium TaxID=99656 RepID=A0A1I0RXL3_9FIRM|nr:Bax inhibitor-1/YccA family protein [[Clostridium] fimetarium]SEW46215.1 hypothetical protein SAMN05421659_13012 [[Clostridium] fimetarium]
MNENFNQNYEPINQQKQMYGSRARIEENVLAQSFIFMTIALIITAIASYMTLTSDNLLYAIETNSGGLFYGLLISEFVVVIVATRAMSHNRLLSSAILFVLYSGINGVTLSVIFDIYQLGSVFSIFIMSAVIFAITAVFGIVTKKDLSTVGNICFMGLIAIIVLSVANMFFIKSNGMDLVISAVGVFIFVGLAAYDSQKIKKMSAVSNSDNITTMALFGALMLYLDFINLFLRLLRLFGKRN